jgi:hypothetical protein
MSAPTVRSTSSLVGFSRSLFAGEVSSPRLFVGKPADSAVLLGAFQRTCELPAEGAAPRAVLRRVSGGGAIEVGPGVLAVTFVYPNLPSLAKSALPLQSAQILNRAVRPLLRALTRTVHPTQYFGRDWLSSDKRPTGLVSFAHETRTDRLVVEAFVSFGASCLTLERASYQGKIPASYDELRGRPVDEARFVEALAEDAGISVEPFPEGFSEPGSLPDPDEPAWTSRVDEALGPLYAGRDASGRVRLGGELVASFDRVAFLERNLEPRAERETRIDRAFTEPGAHLFGVKSLRSVLDVLATF